MLYCAGEVAGDGVCSSEEAARGGFIGSRVGDFLECSDGLFGFSLCEEESGFEEEGSDAIGFGFSDFVGVFLCLVEAFECEED